MYVLRLHATFLLTLPDMQTNGGDRYRSEREIFQHSGLG
jgi:hypothetical protein